MILELFHPGEIARPPAGEAHGRHPYTLYVKGLRAAIRERVATPVNVPVALELTVFTARPGSLVGTGSTVSDALAGLAIGDRLQIVASSVHRRPPKPGTGPGIHIMLRELTAEDE